MAHGFGSVAALCLPAYAERFAAAGYVVVLFDYRYFGDSEGQPRQLLDIAAQLDDWRAALAWARTLDRVDPERVIAWGTSLAGGHVITLAGSGEKLAAIIAQVPHVSGIAAVRSTGLRHALRITPAALQDAWRALCNRPPRYLDSVGAPGTLAVLAAPDALSAVERMAAASGLQPGGVPITVAARIILRIGLYSPMRHATNVRCPALVQVATQDRIAPAAPAQKAAARMPNAKTQSYRCDHFDPYVEPLFDTVVSHQLNFLRSVAPARP
jgi:dienelactone hydrolase